MGLKLIIPWVKEIWDDFLSLNDTFFHAQLGNYDDRHHIFNGLTLILTTIIKVLSENFAHCY